MSVLARITDARGPLFALGLFRVLTGLLVIRHTVRLLQETWTGHFADRFYPAYFEWIPVPDRMLHVGSLYALAALGALVSVGFATRAALAGALVLGAWTFLLNQFLYSNNRMFLLLMLLVLLVSPAHRVLSVDAWLRARRGGGGGDPDPTGPLWTTYAIRGQASLLYLASGLSKLVDPTWLAGDVLWHRAVIVLGKPAAALLSPVRPLLGGGAIALEIFLGIGLWLPRTRRLALWLGFLFHFAIELAFLVHVFSYLMLGTYLLVASSARRNRVLRYRASSRLQALLAAQLETFDWLGKLVVEPSDRLEAVDADGAVYRGPMAFAIAGNAVPLSFPIAYPVTWFRARVRGGVQAAPVPAALEPSAAPFAVVIPAVLALFLLVWEGNSQLYWMYRRFGLDEVTTSKLLWAAVITAALSTAAARRTARSSPY